MAERRMFSKKIIDTDWFMDMPASTQNLYFHLSMRADDDGFVASPKRIIKLIGATDDDYKILIAKKFIIPFECGVCVITDWRINNYLRNDRYTETIYQKEKQTLSTNENGKYILGIPNVNQSSTVMDTQYSIGKDSIELGKDSINNISCAEPVADTALKNKIIITFILNDKSEFPIYENIYNQFCELYPAVNVLQELRNIKAWCISNPSKRKTKSGAMRFVNCWLSKKQNNGGNRETQKKYGDGSEYGD